MSLLALSNELLVEVFLYFTDQKTTLCNIALCSRRLNSVARRVLVRDVQFEMKNRESALFHAIDHGSEAFRLRLERFIEFLDKHRSLSFAVQKFTFWLDFLGETQKLLVHHQIGMILGRLSNLVSFEIQYCPPIRDPRISLRNPRYGRSNTCFALNFLEFPLAQTIRCLALPTAKVSYHDLVKLMGLKRIQFIYIPWFHTETTSPMYSCQHSTSTLISLNLGDNHVPHATLLELLKIPRHLKKLYCSIPGLERAPRENTRLTIRTKKEMCESLSASSVSTIFMAAKHSLEELTVTDSATTWPGQDDSISDFSKLVALKRLRIPSSCFFRASYAYIDKMCTGGIYKLLPPSLEELKIDFDFSRSFLKYEHADQVHEARHYEWLLEIAAHKSSNFPSLQFIYLEEFSSSIGAYGPSNINTIGWEIPHTGKLMLFGREFQPPQPLATALVRAELRFLAIFRAPWFNYGSVYKNEISRKELEESAATS